MDYAKDFVTAFGAGGIVDKADAGITIIGDRTTDILRFAKTKTEMQEWHDALVNAVRSLMGSLPTDARSALLGDEHNAPVMLQLDSVVRQEETNTKQVMALIHELTVTYDITEDDVWNALLYPVHGRVEDIEP